MIYRFLYLCDGELGREGQEEREEGTGKGGDTPNKKKTGYFKKWLNLLT